MLGLWQAQLLNNLASLFNTAGAAGVGSRGLFGGGVANTNVIDYVDITTTGNATDFGDLTQGRQALASLSSSTRGIFGGGFISPNYQNTIDYVTIASTGNAIDFGDLLSACFAKACTSSSTRSVMGGGYTSGAINVIEYITIDTTGNAIDFGDLTVSRYGPTACSSGHGGL